MKKIGWYFRYWPEDAKKSFSLEKYQEYIDKNPMFEDKPKKKKRKQKEEEKAKETKLAEETEASKVEEPKNTVLEESKVE